MPTPVPPALCFSFLRPAFTTRLHSLSGFWSCHGYTQCLVWNAELTKNTNELHSENKLTLSLYTNYFRRILHLKNYPATVPLRLYWTEDNVRWPCTIYQLYKILAAIDLMAHLSCCNVQNLHSINATLFHLQRFFTVFL